mmetsp:Transcript_44229/g.117980  ORF Transcript_44229/g.117980 Transcript_44229/m.117980 type:complete len:121 (-) Transcript_44229:28-390(-)
MSRERGRKGNWRTIRETANKLRPHMLENVNISINLQNFSIAFNRNSLLPNWLLISDPSSLLQKRMRQPKGDSGFAMMLHRSGHKDPLSLVVGHEPHSERALNDRGTVGEVSAVGNNHYRE